MKTRDFAPFIDRILSVADSPLPCPIFTDHGLPRAGWVLSQAQAEGLLENLSALGCGYYRFRLTPRGREAIACHALAHGIRRVWIFGLQSS